jgi:hypothetical protein
MHSLPAQSRPHLVESSPIRPGCASARLRGWLIPQPAIPVGSGPARPLRAGLCWLVPRPARPGEGTAGQRGGASRRSPPVGIAGRAVVPPASPGPGLAWRGARFFIDFRGRLAGEPAGTRHRDSGRPRAASRYAAAARSRLGSSLKQPSPVLHLRQRRPRTRRVAWQWSTQGVS